MLISFLGNPLLTIVPCSIRARSTLNKTPRSLKYCKPQTLALSAPIENYVSARSAENYSLILNFSFSLFNLKLYLVIPSHYPIIPSNTCSSPDYTLLYPIIPKVNLSKAATTNAFRKKLKSESIFFLKR